MAFLRPAHLIPITFLAQGTLTVADDYHRMYVEQDFEIVYVSAFLATLGTSSGNTDFVIEDESGSDLWTVASGVGRIAYGSELLQMDQDDLDEASLVAGRVYTLNVNAIDGGGTNGDLTVTLWVRPVNIDA